MARSKLLDIDTSGMDLSQLADYRRRLAETANRQIRRWKQAGLENTPSAYKNYAEPYLKRHGMKGFSTGKKPLEAKTPAAQMRRELAQIAQMKKYMESASYSKTGYEKVKSKAAQGFARAAGVDLNQNQLDILLKSESFGWLKRTVGSGVLLDVARAIAKGQSTAEETKNRMDDVFSQFAKSADTEKAFKDKPIDEVFEALGLDLDAVLFKDYEEDEGTPFDELMDAVAPKRTKKKAKKKNTRKAKRKTQKKRK